VEEIGETLIGSLFRAIWREIFPAPRRDGMRWTDLRPEAVNQTTVDITGLVDALTQEALNRDTSLYQCQACQVFYQHASYELIRQECDGCCVACQSTRISLAMGGGGGGGSRSRNAAASPASSARPATPAAPASPASPAIVVTLRNYRSYLGQVVTFEGRVVRVLESSSGGSYAAMFEDLPWREGFKMVIREPHLQSVGGASFTRCLARRTVRVRGLITRHAIFGDQINVTDRAMIQAIF
jgi:hypothetical protein